MASYMQPSTGANLEPADDLSAALCRRHLLAVEFRKGALHRIAKSDAFDLADFAEAASAEKVALGGLAA